MRAVLDTNVLISALLFGGSPGERLYSAVRGELRLVTSEVLLDELEGALERKFGWLRPQIRATRAEIEMLAEVVRPPTVPAVLRDPDDDHVLAAAVAGGVDLVISGDRDVLALCTYRGVDIVSPRTAAELLRSGPKGR